MSRLSSTRTLTLALGLLWLVPLHAWALPRPVTSNDFNLILISLTNTRADHLGTYGSRRDTSPNLDRLAAKSVVFENAFTHASWTLPAVMSLFTSQYPFTHGLMSRDQEKPLPAATPTFIELLKAHGYQTGAFVGDRDYGPNFGHTSRFHTTFEPVKQAPADDWKSYGVLEATLPPALEWLRKNADRKFFLLLQAYDTHCPFAVPAENNRFDPDYRGSIDFTKCYWTFERTRPIRRRVPSGEYVDLFLLKTRPEQGSQYEVMFSPEDVRHMIALYDGEIHNADRQLAALFQEIQRLDLERNTVIVFYSDHGDMFGKHGRFMRGGPLRGTFYDDVLRIPLFLHVPGLAPRRARDLVEMIDLGPTLLEVLGLPAQASFRGKSFRRALEQDVALHPHVFAGATFTPAAKNQFFRHNSAILSVRSREWKLIAEQLELAPGAQQSFELYHLAKDPEELTNVQRSQPQQVQEMKGLLRNWLRDLNATNVFPGL